jgi:methionyl-tRNA formyltransferase
MDSVDDCSASSAGSDNTERPGSIALFLNGQRGLTVAGRLAEAGHPITAYFVHGRANLSEDELLRISPNAEITHVDGTNWPAVIRKLKELGPRICIVAGFSYIIPEEVLLLPPGGFLNLHAGRVPQYRGGSPLNWQMIEGESSIGVSILRMTHGIDEGPVVAEAAFELSEFSTIADAHALAEALFGNLVLDVLANLPRALANAEPQHGDDAAYWHQRSDRDGRINVWCQSAEEICRLVRALTHPYPGAWFTRNGDRFRVFAAKDSSGEFRGAPGRIVIVDGSPPIVIVKGGSVRLLDVSCEAGGSPLRNGEYVD